MPSSSPLALPAGTIFADDFVVLRPLSQGGMGAVYVAEQRSTAKQRALKVMLPGLVADPKLRERFEQEARVGARIESEHIVEVVAAGVDAGSETPWLAMELLRGEDLATLVERVGVLPVPAVLAIAEELCHAVGAAHAAGIVHRDLKPENVFLAQSKRAGARSVVKVLDFGIAKIAAEAKTTDTAAVGTPLWMAPEQTTRGSVIGPQTDVWAVGLIVFRLLTGHYYWRTANAEDGGTLPVLLREILLDPMPPASVRAAENGCRAALPAGFDAWFARAVDRNPRARFSNASEMFAALSRILAPDGFAVAPTAPALAAGPGAGAPVPVSAQRIRATVDATVPQTVAPPRVSAPSPTLDDPSLAGRLRASTTAGVDLIPPPPPPSRQRGVGMRWAISAAIVVVAGGGAAAAVLAKNGAQHSGASSMVVTGPATTPSSSATPAATAGTRSVPDDATAGVMVALPGGSFSVGALDGAEDERPPHEERIAAFSMDVTEVTVAAWKACEKAGSCPRAPAEVVFPDMTEADRRGSKFCNGPRSDRLDHPINCVTFDEAQAFCAWAGKRLPSETEWEYAARAVKRGGADARPFPWGTAPPDALRVNACGTECVTMLAREELIEPGQKPSPLYPADDTFPATAPVGSFPRGASDYGLMDMAGNVAEWTTSVYAPYSARPAAIGTGDKRVTRGGAWLFQAAQFLRTTRRGKDVPSTRDIVLGFRCARGDAT